MVGKIIYRKAEIEDVNIVADFVVGCIRYAFTKKSILGPQEYYKSDKFPEDYLEIRRNSLSTITTMSSIAIDSETNQVVGYIEFGPKKSYLKDIDCQSEILCYFVDPQTQGKGVGRALLANIIQLAHDSGKFQIGKENIGVLTLKGNPSITGFYQRIGAIPVQEHEWNVSFEKFVFDMKRRQCSDFFFSNNRQAQYISARFFFYGTQNLSKISCSPSSHINTLNRHFKIEIMSQKRCMISARPLK